MNIGKGKSPNLSHIQRSNRPTMPLPSLVAGNYSVYGLEIHLSRCVSPYLLNVYLPTAIFVVMSWVSFLIPTDVVPARIVLLVTLCLVIINTFNNVT